MANPNNTFIKIYRSLLDWGWHKYPNTLSLFVHLIILANIKDKPFGKITVKRGQYVTSYPKLAQQAGLSIQEVRTALGHLKSTGEITVTTTSKYSIITINNYNRYQKSTHKPTDDQQASNRQATGDQQQLKNIYNNKLLYIKEGKKGRREKAPTLSEIQNFVAEQKLNVNYQKFYDYYNKRNWQINNELIDNWKDLVITWSKKEHKTYASGAYDGVPTINKEEFEKWKAEQGGEIDE